MASSATILRIFAILHLLLVVAADDVSHDDDSIPRSGSPSCNNKFQLVKVKNWVDGVEGESIDGLTARFGATLPSEESKALKLPVVLMNPLNCCTNSSSKLSNSLALSVRGDCAFTTKAQVAQSGGAAGLVVINDNEELYKMVCSDNDTSLNITIPIVMIPKSGGDAIKKSMVDGGKVELLLYSPNRPVVDFSVIFLWLMAVGTILCASLWSEFVVCEQNDERYNQLTPKESSNSRTTRDDSEKEIVDISAKGAIFFVIVASTFLLVLYFFMSSWFVWLLIVLFCIGGIQFCRSDQE
uniref:PA domain-containing protein n=1 Tax=Nelumbo nucifera TaxID=4432 RepID=A0A822XYK4_NELNU|nr:TPA_asm: hypothetical protein HUJ06_025539 [Nelumbo nucifera]